MSNSPVQAQQKQMNRSMSISEKQLPVTETDLASESNWANKYEDFDIGKPIGYGSSAVVYEAIYKPLKIKIAIKIIDLDMFERNQIDELRRETALMALSKHPNVLRVYGSFVNGPKLYIVTPYLAAGSCLDIMKSYFTEGLDEVSIATILKQALEGLIYLHKNGHIHRDVKAGNLLMDDQGTVLLADFGVSSSLTENNEVRKTFVGTPCWMAPEVMEQAGYDYKADIWSFGITSLELATGRAPFAKYPPMKVLMMTISNAPPTLDRENCKHKFTKTFKEMIDLCLQKDPAKRPTAEKLLQHPFFKQAKKRDYLVKSILAYVPSLDQRPHKKLPQKHISVVTTDQQWNFEEDVEPKSAVAPAVTETVRPMERMRSVVKFKEDPPKPERMKSVGPNEKKHISFGEVTVKDASDRPPTIITEPLNETPAALKKSRFVIGDHSIDPYASSPSSYSPPASTPVDATYTGLGISQHGTISSISSSTQGSTIHDGEVKKGRFSVNQTPASTRPTTPASEDSQYIEVKTISRVPSQDSTLERKSRFEVKHNTLANQQQPSTESFHSIPLTRENSRECSMYNNGKISRFSIEKPESVAGPCCEITPSILPPECRKKGRFELTGGSNTPSDSEKASHHDSPQSTVAPSPAISPSNSLSRGQANRIIDPNFPHMVFSHMESLLKQTEIQKNMLQGLLTTLPVLYGPPSRGRTLSDTKKPNYVHTDEIRTTPSHNQQISTDINSTIDHLQQLLLSSSKEREKLIQENEALKKEIERLKKNQTIIE
ncbi:hypothetical protein G6F61_006795 [Rhizopus arrhizus]|nr:hypothetical protein G6F61_006795 [Rhizopus arrhizus]